MKNWLETKAELMSVPVPNHAGRYCPIPHSVFLQELQEKLYAKNMIIKDERYLTDASRQVMTGWFSLKNDTDSEISPSISFINSYNKTKKASIRASALVLVCKNGMMGHVENGHYTRKHLGTTALSDFRSHMDLVIDGVEQEFERLIKNKEELKKVEIDSKIRAYLIGDMYINEGIINSTQLSIVKKEIEFSKNFTDTTAWSLYNHITEALKDNHPLNYEKQHIKTHTYFSDKLGLTGARGLYGKSILNTDIIV